jgi:predicted nuclease of predicted toxin-antitoxin system
VSDALLLDEMLSPEIAAELVKRGHDVVAVAADPALAGLPDEQVLHWATDQGRCLLTENVRDLELLRRAFTAEGRTHTGLLCCGPSRFPATAGSSAPWSPPWSTCWPPHGSRTQTR